MSNWSHGYNVSSGYTFGFYRETAPDWIDFALASRGIVPPRSAPQAPFRYLELGCGQGFGLCLLSAANPQGEFLGVDFSPEHIAHARSLAAELGLTNIAFVEADFAQLGGDWPQAFGRFDYVTLHGIYSWVPKAIRASIVAILAAATEPGAAIYVSHNAMPGWTSTLPFQHILRTLEAHGMASGVGAIEAGRRLFDKMEAAGSGVTRALPALKARIENSRSKPEPYLVQEYLHENWHPLWCSEVMAELRSAKLDLGATATLAEGLLPQVLAPELQDVLVGVTAPRLREDLTDCLINQSFRRDIYVRGLRRRHAQDAGWRETYHLWRVNWSEVPDEIPIDTAYGSVTLRKASIAPLFEAVGEGSMSLEEMTALPQASTDPQLFMQRLTLLIHGGWLACSRGTQGASGVAASANASIAAMACVGAPYRHLAASSLNSAIGARDSELLMLGAFNEDRALFEREGAAMLKQRLKRLGRRLAKNGQPLAEADEEAQLEAQVAEFRNRTLPLWRRLGVID